MASSGVAYGIDLGTTESSIDIGRALLVGGAGKLTILHDLMEEGLGVRLDSSIDPRTVLSQGAAVFADAQRDHRPASQVHEKNTAPTRSSSGSPIASFRRATVARTTIDYGIDLGTTNSSVAVLEGTATDVIKSNLDHEITPSAVWVDGKGRLQVGERAKQRVGDDPENAYSEFKLQMGTQQAYKFAASGQVMMPEELSSEVLKVLRADVWQRRSEDVTAAVITVPAAFELPQCEATNKAARIAGLAHSPLLQEPIAAAMAYSFQSASDRVFWLVYDFGGGTFDAAVINVRDGMIHVVNHGGDNHLGGKLIDWEIVDQILTPAIQKEFNLPNFERGNKEWRGAFAKLKSAVETAKIQLSRDTSASIDIDRLYTDKSGRGIDFVFDLTRADVERMAEPLVERSINISKKVLEEARLGPSDVERLLLVGGPTLTPLFRQMLADKLGIQLESKIDPLTVVSRGAAVFAGTQRQDTAAGQPVSKGQYGIRLEYEPVGTDLEPLVGGKVTPPDSKSPEGLTVEFVESKNGWWRSGKIALSDKGTFSTSLKAEKGQPNEFLIELRDETGKQCETVPDRLTYTIGMTIDAPPLIHSMGVALANNEMDVFLSKGTPLPARRCRKHRTAVEIRQGDSGTLLKIPVVEGENTRRADRNKLIGAISVKGDRLKRSIPAGSEVEITLEIDENRVVKTRAYVPVIGDFLDAEPSLVKAEADTNELAEQVQKEKVRLSGIRERARETPDPRADAVLSRIDSENMLHEIDAALATAHVDPNSAHMCQSRLLDLQNAIDEAEDALEWPSLVREARENMSGAREIATKYGKEPDRHALNTLEREMEETIETRDPVLLRCKAEAVQSLSMRILIDQPGFWVGYLEHLQERKPHMRNQGVATSLFQQGQRAMDNGDVEGLKSAVRGLIQLLPADEQAEVRGYGGTTMPV